MKDDRVYLGHIVLAIRRIHDYTRDGERRFRDDEMIQDAVLRNFQIIGEAAKKVSGELRAANRDIPWSDMAGLRDRVVHDYFGVSLDLVWDVIEKHLPGLQEQVEALQGDRSAARPSGRPIDGQ